MAETFADRVRGDFPFFRENVAGPACVYLDNAATSLRPKCVLDEVQRFYVEVSANVHRGRHLPSEVATQRFEQARAIVAALIGRDQDEVVFTSGTTAAINLVASGLPVPPDAKVAVSILEHHSNVLPWLARRTVIWFDPLVHGPEELDALLGREKVALVALTACSNVSGVLLPLSEYLTVARRYRIPTLVDAAQLAPHRWDELRRIDAEFIAFSAHKMVGPFGVGVLTGKHDWLDRLIPLHLGGGTVKQVTETGYRLRDVPARLEAGTPSIAEIVGFGRAVDYLAALPYPELVAWENELTALLLGGLRTIPGIEVVEPDWVGPRVPVVSVNVRGDLLSAEQLARILSDRYHICVRAGHHCAHPYIARRGLDAITRFSASFYNTRAEVERAVEGTREILMTFA